MPNFIAYADRGDERNVVSQLQFQWKREILEKMGIDWEDCFPEDNDPSSMSILQKAKIRKILGREKIYIEDNEEMNIYCDSELIAKWEKPIFKLHKNLSEVDPKKKWYISIEISCGSVFDNLEGDNNND